MASKSKSIIGGMTVLGIAGIICKLVGVLFSIPLTYVIGAQGQGIYNAVFPTYNLLLTISSAGLPVAVSRMVSSALAKDDPHSAKHVFRVALLLLTTLGCIAAIIMLAGSGMLAARVNQPDSKIGFQCFISAGFSPRSSITGSKKAAAMPTRRPAVGTGPNWLAPRRIKRKDAPQSTPSKINSGSQRTAVGAVGGVVGADAWDGASGVLVLAMGYFRMRSAMLSGVVRPISDILALY